MSPPLFRPPSEGLDQKAVEALRQQLQRITRVLESANGNVRTRLGDAKGITEWTVTNTDGTDVLAVDSAGNLVVSTIAAPDAVWELGEYVEVDPLGGWVVRGNVITITAAYTVTSSDHTILADATGGSFNVLLLSAASVPGQIFNIKRIDGTANEIGITTTSGQTIDGYTSGELGLTEDESFAVQSDSENWRII